MNRQKDEFAIGGLPHQEIRQPLLAGGADDEVGIGDSGGIEVPGKKICVDLCRIERARRDFLGDEPCGCGDFLPPAIIEGDDEIERAIGGGGGLRLPQLRPPQIRRRLRPRVQRQSLPTGRARPKQRHCL